MSQPDSDQMLLTTQDARPRYTGELLLRTRPVFLVNRRRSAKAYRLGKANSGNAPNRVRPRGAPIAQRVSRFLKAEQSSRTAMSCRRHCHAAAHFILVRSLWVQGRSVQFGGAFI